MTLLVLLAKFVFLKSNKPNMACSSFKSGAVAKTHRFPSFSVRFVIAVSEEKKNVFYFKSIFQSILESKSEVDPGSTFWLFQCVPSCGWNSHVSWPLDTNISEWHDSASFTVFEHQDEQQTSQLSVTQRVILCICGDPPPRHVTLSCFDAAPVSCGVSKWLEHLRGRVIHKGRSPSAVILWISTHGTPLVQSQCSAGTNCCEVLSSYWAADKQPPL